MKKIKVGQKYRLFGLYTIKIEEIIHPEGIIRGRVCYSKKGLEDEDNSDLPYDIFVNSINPIYRKKKKKIKLVSKLNTIISRLDSIV